jgi:hypothetical protein
MIGALQSSPCIIFIILGSSLTVFMKGSSITWRNTSGGSTAFLAVAFVSSSASMFFVLYIYRIMNPLKKFSILRIAARYLSRVSSLAMHCFSIWLAITLESIFIIQCWIPIARNLRRPSNTASYSAIFLMQLFVSAVNCSHTAYLSLMPEGEISIAAVLALETPQALSQCTCHGVSNTMPSVYLDGSVQSAIKSASTCDLMALVFSKSTTCSDSSMDHFPILPEESRFSKMSFSGGCIRTLTLRASK